MYYYLLMFQNDLLKNNVIEELLRERTNYYLSQKKKKDFWIVLTPTLFNENEKKLISNSYYGKKEQKENYYAAFVSTNKELINWIALRLGDFEELKNISSKSSNEKILNYNGIRGQKEIINSSTSFPFLKSNSEELDPSIYIERYQKAKKLFLEEALN